MAGLRASRVDDSEHPSVHLDHHATDEQFALPGTSNTAPIRRTSSVLARGKEVGDTVELAARCPVAIAVDRGCDLLSRISRKACTLIGDLLVPSL